MCIGSTFKVHNIWYILLNRIEIGVGGETY